jgi:tetratricopeptide (TPR) repeat protein/tRNA A-37 threonylcarbamoyl transferase component Bud32
MADSVAPKPSPSQRGSEDTLPQASVQHSPPTDDATLPAPQPDVTVVPPLTVQAGSPDFRNEETIVPTVPPDEPCRKLSGGSASTISDKTVREDFRQDETMVPSLPSQTEVNQATRDCQEQGSGKTAVPLATANEALEASSAQTVVGATKIDTSVRSQQGNPRKRLDIPGYQILSVLGRGGMGVVYKARHVRLNRLVALKMMLAGAHSSSEQCARFRSEAEAVARLQHPNIVQIYEIGEHDGRPFFSLELVEGGSLEKKLEGNPQPPRLAAELVETLARAMHVAHRAGIIHRDLKPANILLQLAEGGSVSNLQAAVPKVTDFGLAKSLDNQEGQTQTGAIMGTPSYMAPEQAAGKTREIGPGVDIYALGSILYDLLTGRPPFRGETVMDTLNQVQCMEPLPPVRLQPTVPRDLETICLKCLQKEPGKRYASALELADDLRCFLANKPIKARPVGVTERILKWARRHPAAAALVVVSSAVLIGLGVGGLVFARRERRRADEALVLRGEAEESARQARQEKSRAEDNFSYARAAVDEMLTRVSQGDLAHEPRMEKVRRDLLLKALHFYERFVQDKSDDPRVRWEMGRAQQRVGDIQELLGQHASAAKAYRSAEEILGQLAAEEPQQADYRQDLATTQNNLGIVLQAAGRREEAEEAYRQSLANKVQLAANFPAVPAYRRELASSYNNRGIFLQTRNQAGEAEIAYRQALALFEKLTSEFPENADYQQELARTCSNLGVLLQTIRQPQKAEAAYRQAVEALTNLAARFPKAPDYQKERGRALFNLGVLLQLNGQHARAEEAYRQAANIFVQLSKEFPSVPEYRHQLAVSYGNLGNLSQDLHHSREAEELWRQSQGLLEGLVSEVPGVPIYRQELARSHNDLAGLLASASRASEAEEQWRRALAIQETLAREFPREPAYQQELARSHGNLGILMAQLNRLDQAEESFRKAIEVLQALGTQFPDVPAYREDMVVHLTNLANLLTALGRKRDAEEIWRAVWEQQKKLVAAFPKKAVYQADLARTESTLAISLHERNQDREARDLLQAAVNHQTQALKAAPRNEAYRNSLCAYCLNLADIEVALEDHAAASQTIKELLTLVPANWQNYHRAAYLLAACATLTRQDTKAAPEQQRQSSQAYGEQAVALLRQAWNHGYHDLHFLKTAGELDVLRDREDFKTLLAQMESQATTKRP